MHYILLYPQNGDRIVTTDSVTSPHPMYSKGTFVLLPGAAQPDDFSFRALYKRDTHRLPTLLHVTR